MGPRRPGGPGHYRPGRRYYVPSVRWGTSWWWGGPWDWWWWGSGWNPFWGWGGVTVIQDDYPAPDDYARVDTDVSPESAEVFLDGTYIGSADDFDGYPDFLYLEPGKYRLEFRHPSYETVVKELLVKRGHQVRMTDDLKLLAGKGRMDSFDPDHRGMPLGRVFGKGETDRKDRGDRTGRFEAKTGPDDDELDDLDELDELDDLEDPDDPDEDVRPRRLPSRPAAPKADAGATTPDTEDVAPAERGRFRFEVEPEDAAVYLDDRYVGTAEELAGLRRGLPVKAGKHVVTVVRPGYATKTVDVESKPGAAIDVVIELEK
jgi:hypothetical protein